MLPRNIRRGCDNRAKALAGCGARSRPAAAARRREDVLTTQPRSAYSPDQEFPVVARADRYPSTRYRLQVPPDLGVRAERERLSPAALKAFFNIMTRWKVRDEDARALLGGVTNGPYYEMKRDPDRVLEIDRLTRISYLIGIFKALRILHSPALADEWVRLPNGNPIFGGQTPLAYMMGGGLPAMQTVRRLLDARRAG
jgi:hypothetical protein